MKTPPQSKPKAQKYVAHYNGVALPTDSHERRRVRNKLSAQVHRKRKQDALKTARDEVASCDAQIRELKGQLNDTRARVASLQSVMDALAHEFGPEALRDIYEQCGVQAPYYGHISGTVTSDSEHGLSSSATSTSSSDDELSLGCAREQAAI
ncbi:hypothetical protein ACHAXT_004711 [Thalassiosira profunda]